MSIPLRICSACNLILALIVLLSMILSNYKNLQVKTYSQYTAVGIWTALLLACNGASMLLYLKRKFLCKPQQMYMVSLFLCIATLLAGIFTIGIAAGTFYGLLSESPAPQSAFKLSQLGYSFCISSKTDEFTSLKALEGTLFGCGLASIFVNSLSIMFLHLEKLMLREETVSPGSLPTRNFNRY
ncbi:uncharacterized protein LOC116928962 isoform X2 [Daphnia magna]|uniref:Uncharacterized protein n=1 Tax=Daphnia magna TaxID=35525 RepID=A0A162C8L0_9CRUS|nr:uncharacterized protein LOC116928962 isoform X2 [Daphnia magna]KZS12802.1 Uncharacterized protein APZ42_022024 [Daphnia magna]